VGLGPTAAGSLMGLYGFAVYFLPIFAGPAVDRFGFRRSLVACFLIYTAGFSLVALAGLPEGAALVAALGKGGYATAALLLTAVGASLIKPCIVGTVARTTNEETKGLGYSIYYMLVNVGGATGPILALQVRERFGIAYVLVMSAATCALLVFGALLFYKEPPGAPEKVRTIAQVLSDAALVFKNGRFIAFLVIFSGFWIMFWQTFISLPPYVRDVLKFERYEILETVDAWSLILLTVPITALMKKVRPILAMTIGFAIASAAWLVIARSATWQGVVVAMFLFAIGEGMQAPRFYEYVADLAPKESIGTYMGFAFLPIAIGYGLAGPLGGFLVERYVKSGTGSSGMWVILSAIGFGTTILMVLYDRFVAPRRAAA
jgi:MFS family permease